MKQFFNVTILILASFNLVIALNCDNVVIEEAESSPLTYLASVNFTVPKAVEGDWVMEMKTDVPFTFLGGWGVWVNSDPDEGKASFKSRLENNTLAEGDQVSFRFRISWFRGDERPTVQSLTWEGVELCKGEGGNDLKTVVTPITIASRRRRTSDRRRVNYRKRYYINL